MRFQKHSLLLVCVALQTGFASATPLTYAAAFGNKPEIKRLLDAGADVHAKSASGGAALIPAAGEPAEQHRPVRPYLPNEGDRKEPPRLLAPGGCSTCKYLPFSWWQQFQFLLSLPFPSDCAVCSADGPVALHRSA
jgi:hypothetical protein